MANADEYLGLLSAYHRPRPRFGATVAAVCGAAAVRDLYAGMPDAFDLDLAVGAQLDAVGCWIGRAPRRHADLRRLLRAGHRGLGMDQGVWQALRSGQRPDRAGRRHVPAAAAGQNRRQPWDGTLETSAAILNQIFQGGTHVLIEDNGDMSVDIGVAAPPSALFLALLTGGYIPIKPEGVRIKYYVLPRARAAVRF